MAEVENPGKSQNKSYEFIWIWCSKWTTEEKNTIAALWNFKAETSNCLYYSVVACSFCELLKQKVTFSILIAMQHCINRMTLYFQMWIETNTFFFSFQHSIQRKFCLSFLIVQKYKGKKCPKSWLRIEKLFTIAKKIG